MTSSVKVINKMGANIKQTIETTLRDGYFPDPKTDINFIIDYFEKVIIEDEYVDETDKENVEDEVILQMSKITRPSILSGAFEGNEDEKRIYHFYMEDNKEVFEQVKKLHKEILKNNKQIIIE